VGKFGMHDFAVSSDALKQCPRVYLKVGRMIDAESITKSGRNRMYSLSLSWCQQPTEWASSALTASLTERRAAAVKTKQDLCHVRR